VKKEDGVFTVVAQDSVPYIMGQTYHVKCVACGSILQFYIDGALVFWVTDGDPGRVLSAYITGATRGATSIT